MYRYHVFGAGDANMAFDAASLMFAALIAKECLMTLSCFQQHIAQLTKPQRAWLVTYSVQVMVVLFVVFTSITLVHADEAELLGAIDQPMHEEPRLEIPENIETFPKGIVSLWEQALRQPDVNTRMLAIDAFGRASERGLDVPSFVSQQLADWLVDTEQSVMVRRAAATALARMKAKQHVEAMLAANMSGDTVLIRTIDTALARWQAEGAIPVWQARLTDQNKPHAQRLSAASSLGIIQADQAQADLLAIIENEENLMPLRFASAKAIGMMHELVGDGLALAETYVQGSDSAQLLAAAILQNSDSSQAWALLDTLLQSEQQAILTLAVLPYVQNGLDRLTIEQGTHLLDTGDSLTRQAVRVILRSQATSDSVELLFRMLDDPDATIRAQVRSDLLQLSERSQLKSLIEQQTARAVNMQSWRVLEQAALIAGSLQLDQTSSLLIALLSHDRAEVRLAAVVGLRRIANPDNLPAMLERAQAIAPRALSTEDSAGYNDELSQLFQAFGLMEYKPAASLAMNYVPKGSGFVHVREAAIWSLGKINTGVEDAQLIRTLSSRLADANPMNPEMPEVQVMAAIAIGMMKPSSPPAILTRLANDSESREVTLACRWALNQITGDPIEPLEPLTTSLQDWFIIPLD